MAKIMLVEDDNNLREIYGARLQAEGYDIVSAPDGEEALALAVKEKPDLIISDVMMPRISGFDMLDILRNAPETKDTKVIMMTALSQAEDKARADKLGANRYLVKSQVTLEDVANAVREVLAGEPAGGAASPAVSSAIAVTDDTAADTTETPEADTETQPKPSDVPPPEPAAEPAPAPEPVAPVPPPVTSGTSDPLGRPEMPDVVPKTEDEASDESAAPPTVEAIAEPKVDIVDDDKPGAVQPPPQAAEAPTPTITKVTVSTPTEDLQPGTAPAKKTDNAPAPAVEAQPDLPPVVEPKPAEPIKVELPTPPDEAPATSAQEPTEASSPEVASASTPVATAPGTAPPVGPSLNEALATESKEAEDNPPTPALLNSEPEVPAVANGAPVNTVVEPTETPAPVKAESEPAQKSTAAVGGERVIQPLNDASAKPNINELIAAEEAKGAVINPAANTVIKPGGEITTPAPADASAKPANDLNNIAL